MDIFGPITVYVPWFEKVTGNRIAQQDWECYVTVIALPVTWLLSWQVIKKKDQPGIVNGITQLACKIGIPKTILLFKNLAFLKSISEV